MSLLLETAAASPAIPSWVMGALALVILLGAIAWIVGFGSGRPHSK
ncbi:hypothetical protein TESS_TESS_00891 [Tessaracoccus sp. O5.2]|jgi:hypothetical protein|nr:MULTISPECIES: hypothetical protein [Tessaracoccus]VEP41629.1 hypothetical protein TLA_TLA_02751 [Tessaracoccus lapidicaptus]